MIGYLLSLSCTWKNCTPFFLSNNRLVTLTVQEKVMTLHLLLNQSLKNKESHEHYSIKLEREKKNSHKVEPKKQDAKCLLI